MADTDAMFDTGEPAMSNRIARFKVRIQESPTDRALQNLTLAVEDVDAAILLARSPEELASIVAAVDTCMARLLISSSVAETLGSMKEWL